MLQRAASNAYSWWWAGHIRTKQSKWLEQSLQDMEEKVGYVLKLIEEDGDSFAKRAEMYYKKRPELTNFVEESYRAFRALAERYDSLSTELQNANNTLATCFPDQIPMDMDEDYEYGSPRIPRMPPQIPPANGSSVPKVPKVPKAPKKNLKGLLQTATKQLREKKKEDAAKSIPKSGLSKTEAIEEIDKLQKDILALQTVKEYVKSSYQSRLEKYWNIENQIIEMQQKVCSLHDEFGIDKVIEDEEARKLMAQTALKSCQETLAQLQEIQEKSAREAKEECKKIEDAHQRLKSIRHEFLHEQTAEEKPRGKDESTKTGDVMPSSSPDLGEGLQKKQEIKVLQEKIKEQFDASAMESITVPELAEKIDELVSKVISLESDVSSQNVLMNRLRSESDELQTQIRILEDDKATLTEGKHDLNKKVKELEEKLKGIQNLNQNVENQSSNFITHVSEARSNLDQLSEKLTHVNPDNKLDIDGSSQKQEKTIIANASLKEPEEQKDRSSGGNENLSLSKIGATDVKEGKDSEASPNGKGGEAQKPRKKTVTWIDPKPLEKREEKTNEKTVEKTSSDTGKDSLNQSQKTTEKEKEDLNWQAMLLSGVEDKEDVLLTDYTEVLKNYKDIKKKLSDIEKKEKDGQSEVPMQISELKSAIAKRDEEIQRLRHKLNAMGENKDGETLGSPPSGDNSAYSTNKEDDDMKLYLMEQPAALSHVEEQLRMDIDAILEENLDFWLRFSTAYHQIQKYKSTVEDLQDEISKIKHKKKTEDSAHNDVKSEVRPIYKHMKEIETELIMWLEQSVSLKDEMERRSTSLCNIQEKITAALKEGVEEEQIIFSSHQAAKFQGEVLNMKQENNKVRDELQAGVDHITSLQVQVDRTLRKLNDEFRIAGDQQPLGSASNRQSIPLSSFIFGTKPKKPKSIFSCMAPNKKYQVLRAGVPL